MMEDSLIADDVRMAIDTCLPETLTDARQQTPADDYRLITALRVYHRR